MRMDRAEAPLLLFRTASRCDSILVYRRVVVCAFGWNRPRSECAATKPPRDHTPRMISRCRAGLPTRAPQCSAGGAVSLIAVGSPDTGILMLQTRVGSYALIPFGYRPI